MYSLGFSALYAKCSVHAVRYMRLLHQWTTTLLKNSKSPARIHPLVNVAPFTANGVFFHRVISQHSYGFLQLRMFSKFRP